MGSENKARLTDVSETALPNRTVLTSAENREQEQRGKVMAGKNNNLLEVITPISKADPRYCHIQP